MAEFLQGRVTATFFVVGPAAEYQARVEALRRYIQEAVPVMVDGASLVATPAVVTVEAPDA